MKPVTGIIGPGALGTALGLRLLERGYPVAAVAGRTRASAVDLAARLGAAASSAACLPAGIEWLFCCVPDRALPGLAADLARRPYPWAGCVAAHTSGALGADVLDPLREVGAAVLGFHPMQTFPPGSTAGAFEGVMVGLEGSEEAVAAGRRMAEGLGLRAVVIPAGARTRYHLAGSMASNFLVTLFAAVDEVTASIGLSPDERAGLLKPLVQQTMENLFRNPPAAALTGPIVRGDASTVALHLAALADHLPHLASLYRALAGETCRLAEESGRLTPEGASAVRRALEPPPGP